MKAGFDGGADLRCVLGNNTDSKLMKAMFATLT